MKKKIEKLTAYLIIGFAPIGFLIAVQIVPQIIIKIFGI